MSKRLEALKKMIASNAAPDKSFAHYALAMEYKSLDRHAESLEAFKQLKTLDPEYVAQYLMAGNVCEALGLPDEARAWYGEGIERARAKGDSHTLSELQTALAAIKTP
jgi:tetratricopeptide (TPR) repeat protein